ncbi:MAG: helix-turn-helix domain-containing protein [Eubacterium sp.]|nr:helix-turn-helix domain-containing protein [Eubacterium sp.]
MSKSKWSAEFRAMVSQEYLDGKGSYGFLANKYHIGLETIRRWVVAYKVHGIDAFVSEVGNKSYTHEFKIMCVEEVIAGYGSSVDIGAKYKVNTTVLESWIKLYNANRELRDYIPKREIYMADARRKTTIEERKDIVEYCLSHGRDYKGTASIFDVSYSQVYSWVKKYDTNGEEALIDKRGRHKADDEVDELERLRRENKKLKRQLEENDMLVQLLKKVKEFEGM